MSTKVITDVDTGEVYFEEWRVTGDPGGGFPPYGFVWSPERNPSLGDPEASARAFVALVVDRAPAWDDGPHLSMRWVKRSNWCQVEP